MAVPRIGGGGIPLNLTGALGGPLPQQGSLSFSPTRGTNAITLPAGQGVTLPAGTYYLAPGPYTSVQWLDPVTQIWRTINAEVSLKPYFIDSDGGNFRLFNMTGTPVGALITNAGSGATNGIGTTATGITVTSSAGGSVWVPVVGGSINSTVAITAGGSGYRFAPTLVFDAPPVGGIQATGVCTISGGAIATVTVTNQGAGYTVAPNITIINHPLDTNGSGGVLTVNATLAGSGILTALYPSSAVGTAAATGGSGTPVTTLPTLSFSGTGSGSMAATVVMNWVVTSIGVANPGGGGTGWSTPTTAMVINGALVAGTRASNVAGPIADIGLTQPRPAFVQMALSVGTINTTGHIVIDAGFGFQAVPNVNLINANAGAVAQNPAASVNAQVGGITDTSWVQPA